MDNRNIVVAPCGNKSFLFKSEWLKEKELKQFDLCLLFYHEHIIDESLYGDADYFYHLKGFKYHMLYQLFTDIHPEWLDRYDYFYFIDDDIEIDTRSINQLFMLSKTFKSMISQASLSYDSFCSWPMFRTSKKSFCRFVGQIEVMAPLFDADSLKRCLPSFSKTLSSWGVDAVWSKILEYPKDKLIVFDRVIMRHTLPVGGGELYQKIGVSPHEEWITITNEYGARKHNYQEYGRLMLINQKSNRTIFFCIKIAEFFSRLKRNWRDLDIISRIKLKLRSFFKR